MAKKTTIGPKEVNEPTTVVLRKTQITYMPPTIGKGRNKKRR